MAKPTPAFQCHHIMDSGQRCGSPRMKRKEFCYYHNRLHESFILPGQEMYEAPDLDNLHSISIALTQINRALDKGLINPGVANAMIYSIQVAKQTLRQIEKSTPLHPDPS